MILSYLKEAVENKDRKILDPQQWIEASFRLNLLLGDEVSLLADMRQIVAKMKLDYLNESEKINVSEARIKAEVTDDYKEMKKQEAKIKQIEEFIRIAKLQARSEGGF